MAKSKTTAAAKSKAAAARKEKEDKPEDAAPETIEVRGLELRLPTELPATYAFDVAEMQQEASVFAVIRMLTTFLGDEQIVAVRGKVAREKINGEDFDDFLAEIVEAVFGAFGLSLGE